MEACVPCEAGTGANAGATACDACPAGFARGLGESVCGACVDGFVAPYPGLAADAPDGGPGHGWWSSIHRLPYIAAPHRFRTHPLGQKASACTGLPQATCSHQLLG